MSVIIPTYNYGHYIGRALDSLLQQDYDQRLIEVIVVDDGSLDNTEYVVANYKGFFNKLEYFKTANNGKAAATYFAFQYCTGDIIFNLDADDIFLPTKIKRVVSIFSEHPEVSHVGHSALIDISSTGECISEHIPLDICDKVIEGKELFLYFLQNNCLWGGGSTFSVRRLKNFLSKDTPLCDMYIDEFLVYRALCFGKSIIKSEPLSVWKVHGLNYSVSERLSNKKMYRLRRSFVGMLSLFESLKLPFFNIYRLKYLANEVYYTQLVNKNISWSISLCRLLISLIQIALNSPSVALLLISNYNITKRIIPPFLFLYLKKSATLPTEIKN